MNRSAFIAFGFAGALALVASPAAAQHRRSGGGARHDSTASRQQQRVAPRQEFRSTQRGFAPGYAPRYYNSGRYYGSGFSIGPSRFYRPYYAFRPRLNIGFGLWAGYPISYYDPYYVPYDYAPYATAGPGYQVGPGYQGGPSYQGGPGYQGTQAYPPQGSVNAQPNQQNQSNMGGLSFQITPDTAEVYVDGNDIGAVGQFSPTSQPLGLPAGRHHIELRERGYAVMSFDVDIAAGQVIPYSGTLEH